MVYGLLVVMKEYPNDTCSDEIGQRAQKYKHHFGLNNEQNWGRSMTIYERNKILTWTSYNFCMTTPIPKLEMTIFMIRNS